MFYIRCQVDVIFRRCPAAVGVSIQESKMRSADANPYRRSIVGLPVWLPNVSSVAGLLHRIIAADADDAAHNEPLEKCRLADGEMTTEEMPGRAYET